MIPIFEKLVAPLEDAFERAGDGEVLILPMLQGRTSASLRKPLVQAIGRAGGRPWTKLWTTLRATRDTEFRESFP